MYGTTEAVAFQTICFEHCLTSRGQGVDRSDHLVEIGDRGVDVGGYADAADVLPHDADGVNLVLIEESVLQLCGRHAVDAYATDGAGVLRIERSVQFYLLCLLNARCPVVLQ